MHELIVVWINKLMQDFLSWLEAKKEKISLISVDPHLLDKGVYSKWTKWPRKVPKQKEKLPSPDFGPTTQGGVRIIRGSAPFS